MTRPEPVTMIAGRERISAQMLTTPAVLQRRLYRYRTPRQWRWWLTIGINPQARHDIRTRPVRPRVDIYADVAEMVAQMRQILADIDRRPAPWQEAVMRATLIAASRTPTMLAGLPVILDRFLPADSVYLVNVPPILPILTDDEVQRIRQRYEDIIASRPAPTIHWPTER